MSLLHTDGFGVLPKQQIKQLISNGFVAGASEKNINPASLDLSMTEEVYRIEKIFLPRPGEPIRDLLSTIGATPHNLEYPFERGVIYLAYLSESLSLPKTVYAYCNPKSSTGRNDVLARVLADGIWRYDSTKKDGYKGSLWLAIQPQSFSIKLSPGETISQMRFFNRYSIFNEPVLELSCDAGGLLWSPEAEQIKFDDLYETSDHDGTIILTAHVPDGLVGWESIDTTRPIDFSKRKHYQPTEFFRPIHSSSGQIDLIPGRFYILYTREYLRIPPNLSCEVVPMDERAGEHRTHYAGYIDPGWGWEDASGKGRRIVLEVRVISGIVTLRNGQPVTKVRFERMCEVPESNYDSKDTHSNYARDFPVPLLSKHFDMSQYAPPPIACAA
jgi:dCTP deaminase